MRRALCPPIFVQLKRPLNVDTSLPLCANSGQDRSHQEPQRRRRSAQGVSAPKLPRKTRPNKQKSADDARPCCRCWNFQIRSGFLPDGAIVTKLDAARQLVVFMHRSEKGLGDIEIVFFIAGERPSLSRIPASVELAVDEGRRSGEEKR